MSYGADLADSYRRVAYYVDKNPEGCKACRSAGGAADEVRVGDQSEDGEADRPDDSAGGARPGEQVDQVTVQDNRSDARIELNSPSNKSCEI